MRSGRESLGKSEGKTRFLDGLSEILSLDLDVPNGQHVIGNESRHFTGSIMDLERCAILLVRLRRARIVLLVKPAGNGCAFLAGNPQVA